MSTYPDFGRQAMAPTTDNLSRRHLVTGAAVVAALGVATAEALAQGAPEVCYFVCGVVVGSTKVLQLFVTLFSSCCSVQRTTEFSFCKT